MHNDQYSTYTDASVRKKNSSCASVETNTEPWSMVTCQKCTGQDEINISSVVDVNEYIKAITYINSMHSVINTSLAKQANNNGRSINVPTNFSLPDLPNFLTILSSFNNVCNSNSQIDQVMISRATSTTSISNSCTFISKHKEANHHKQKYENSSNGNQRTNGMSKTELYENEFKNPPTRKSFSIAPQKYPQEQIIGNGYIIKSTTNKAVEQQNNNRQVKHKAPIICDKTGNVGKQQYNAKCNNIKEVRGRSRSSSASRRSFQSGNKETFNRTAIDREMCCQSLLSDAQLDRYASELLTGLGIESCHALPRPRYSGKNATEQKSSTGKSRSCPMQPELEPRKMMSKAQEIIARAVTERPHTCCTAQKQHRLRLVQTCKSPPGVILHPQPDKNFKNYNMDTQPPLMHTTASLPVKRNVTRSAPPVATHTNMECPAFSERKKLNKDTSKKNVNAKSHVMHVQLEHLPDGSEGITNKNISKRNNINISRQAAQAGLRYSALCMSDALQIPQLKKNKANVSNMKQLEDDDGMYSQNSLQSHTKGSTDSMITSDLDDHSPNFINNIFDNENSRHGNLFRSPSTSSKSSRQERQPQKYSKINLQISKKETSPDLETNLLTKENVILDVPIRKKKENCQTTLREAIKNIVTDEVKIQTRKSRCQRRSYCDSVSVESETTGSSDIKSDAECVTVCNN